MGWNSLEECRAPPSSTIRYERHPRYSRRAYWKRSCCKRSPESPCTSTKTRGNRARETSCHFSCRPDTDFFQAASPLPERQEANRGNAGICLACGNHPKAGGTKRREEEETRSATPTPP